jgi:hypothetical protein
MLNVPMNYFAMASICTCLNKQISEHHSSVCVWIIISMEQYIRWNFSSKVKITLRMLVLNSLSVSSTLSAFPSLKQ